MDRSADVPEKAAERNDARGALSPPYRDLHSALAAAETVVEAAIDLYSRPASQISRRPDQVVAQARKILTAGLALRAQLQGRSLLLGSELHRFPEEVIELGR